MERYFQDEDTDNTGLGELPQAKQISRDAFSQEDFRADEFLTSYHKFQTLDDLQKQLKQWSEKLSQELVDVINEDYGDFLHLGKQLSGGESKVQDVKMEIQSFQKETTKVKNSLDHNRKEIDALLEKKKHITLLQNRAKGLLIFSSRLDELESSLNDTSLIHDPVQLESIAKKYLALIKLTKKMKGRENFINFQTERLDQAKQKLIKELQGVKPYAKDEKDLFLRLIVLYQEVSKNS